MTPLRHPVTRRGTLLAGMAAGLGLVAPPAVLSGEPELGDADGSGHGADDFDFLIGSWQVRHRKLKRRLASSNEWDEFPGTLSVRKILGGLGNVDENVLLAPTGRYEASSLRLFNPAARQWSIYWIDARNPAIDPPMVGLFANGLGSFFNDDVFERRPIKVRFTYQSLTPTSATWTC